MTDRDIARDDLCRAVPFNLTRSEGATDGLTLEGYGAVFGETTRIDSWEGAFDEVIAPGAFKKSLRERTPRLQFDHGTHPLIGSIPIGRITDIGEDASGLRVVARLSDNWLVEPVRDAIAEGAVDGMSFRFSVVRDEWHDAAGKTVKPDELARLLWSEDPERGTLTRTLREVKISEVGPVVWPAYEATSVAVRSKVTIDLGRLQDPAQRATLARAVMLADAATRDTQTTPEPPATDTPSADEHPEDDPETPPATDAPAPAGEHESETPTPDVTLTDDVDQARTDQQRAVFNDALAETRAALTLVLTNKEN
jgi:HK97 family phage prohead protease